MPRARKPFHHGRLSQRKVTTNGTLFGVGDAVRDQETRDVGHVDELGPGGKMSIVWVDTGAREWVDRHSLVWAPDVSARR